MIFNLAFFFQVALNKDLKNTGFKRKSHGNSLCSWHCRNTERMPILILGTKLHVDSQHGTEWGLGRVEPSYRGSAQQVALVLFSPVRKQKVTLQGVTLTFTSVWLPLSGTLCLEFYSGDEETCIILILLQFSLSFVPAMGWSRWHLETFAFLACFLIASVCSPFQTCLSQSVFIGAQATISASTSSVVLWRRKQVRHRIIES